MHHEAAKSLVGLDMNGTRAVAVTGGEDGPRHSVQLETDHVDLPMVLNLEGRRPEVGRSGLRLLRRMPHLVCHDFLAGLGRSREWSAGRHRLNAGEALSVVLQHLQPLWSRAAAAGLALPSYLEPSQALLIGPLAKEARLPLTGMVPASLALALSAHAQQPWTGPALVLEVDDHALTWTAVAAENDELRYLGSHALTHLRQSAWKDRLLDSVAEHCIRQNRRDPRAYPEVEQMLYEQIGRVLTANQQGQVLELVIQREQWYHNMLLRFEDVARVCSGLVGQAVKAMQELSTAVQPTLTPPVLISSWQAAHLPGLISAVEFHREEALVAQDAAADPRDETEPDPSAVCVLPESAAAHAVHALAANWFQADPSPRFVDTIPLPFSHSAEAGQPRLSFRGRDYLLPDASFVLGWDSDCDLVFDAGLYPGVSSRHCEIVCDRWAFGVRDMSKNGTLVNGRPVIREVALHAGDWIQLGKHGPRLRFLGQFSQPRQLVTTA
jgi:hypothetical protein